MHRNKKKKLKNDVFFLNQAVALNSNKSAFYFCKVIKTAMDIQDNVYLTPADNRDDLIKRIVAVCEQIPPEFLLNATMGVSGRCRMESNFKHLL
jgi:hypothetical protein